MSQHLPFCWDTSHTFASWTCAVSDYHGVINREDISWRKNIKLHSVLYKQALHLQQPFTIVAALTCWPSPRAGIMSFCPYRGHTRLDRQPNDVYFSGKGHISGYKLSSLAYSSLYRFEAEKQDICCEIVSPSNGRICTIKSHQHDCQNVSWIMITPMDIPKWTEIIPRGLKPTEKHLLNSVMMP